MLKLNRIERDISLRWHVFLLLLLCIVFEVAKKDEAILRSLTEFSASRSNNRNNTSEKSALKKTRLTHLIYNSSSSFFFCADDLLIRGHVVRMSSFKNENETLTFGMHHKRRSAEKSEKGKLKVAFLSTNLDISNVLLCMWHQWNLSNFSVAFWSLSLVENTVSEVKNSSFHSIRNSGRRTFFCKKID